MLVHLALVATVSVSGVPAPDSVRLVLTEVGAIPLPTAFDVVGGDGLDPSLMVVWARLGGRLLVMRRGVIQEAYTGDTVPVISARLIDSAHIEVLEQRRLRRIDLRTGSQQSKDLVGDTDAIRSARYGEDRWIAAGGSPDGTAAISSLSWTDPVVRPIGVIALNIASTQASEVRPTTWSTFVAVGDVGSGRILLAQMGHPHRIAALPFGIDAVAGARPLVSQGFPAGADGGAWVAAACVPLSHYILQGLVDLRSDRRTLVLYDAATFAPVTAIHSDIPLTLLSRVRTGAPHLLALRSAGAPELVVYRADTMRNHTAR